MTELDRLMLCLEDARTIEAIRSADDLRAFFGNSRTGIEAVFEETADQVLERWLDDGQRIARIREYLLMEYIAYNIAEIYNSYDLVRDMFEAQLQRMSAAPKP
jgi:hypothetical protein